MAHFLIELQCMPSLFTEFVTERGRQWHEEPLQPAWRCVEQLIHLIMRTVQGSTVVGGTSSIPQCQNLDELVLTDKEVGAFMRLQSMALTSLARMTRIAKQFGARVSVNAQ